MGRQYWREDSDLVVTEGTSRRILGRISADGTITEGTGSRILGRISEDGTITEGTGRRIIGRVGPGPSAAGGGFGLTIAVAVFFALGCLYFSIFLLPGVLAGSFADMGERGNTVGIVTLALTLSVTVLSCLLLNVLASKEKARFGERLLSCYLGSAAGCFLTIVVCSFFTGEFSFFLVAAGLLVSVLFAVLPALVLCPIFHLIRSLRP